MRSSTLLQVGERLNAIQLAAARNEATTAQRAAPPSDPASRWFLRPRAVALLVGTNFIRGKTVGRQLLKELVGVGMKRGEFGRSDGNVDVFFRLYSRHRQRSWC